MLFPLRQGISECQMLTNFKASSPLWLYLLKGTLKTSEGVINVHLCHIFILYQPGPVSGFAKKERLLH